MKKGVSKSMGISLIILSCFFIFNPDMSAADPLPDLFGYAVMYIALARLSDIDYHFNEARKKFRYGIYTGIAEIVALIMLFGLVTPSERALSILILTFVFGLADIFIVVTGFKELIEGFESLGTLCDGRAMFIKRNGKNGYSEKIYRLTVIFAVAKAACTCLPECTSLIDNAEYRFVGVLRGFGIIISLIFGTVWLVSCVRFLVAIKKDRIFIDNILTKYNTFAACHPDVFTKRALLTGIGIICIGFMLSIDIYGDYYNYLPDFVGAVIIFFGVFSLRSFSPKWKMTAITSLIYTVISAASWIASLNYLNQYTPHDSLKISDAYYKFYTMFFVDIADALVFSALAVLAVLFMADIAMTHAAPRGQGLLKKDDFYYEELTKSKRIFVLLAILSSAMTLYYIYFTSSYSDEWHIRMSVIFTAICDISFAVYAFWFGNALKKEISRRYELS